MLFVNAFDRLTFNKLDLLPTPAFVEVRQYILNIMD